MSAEQTVYEEIRVERARQDAMWGGAEHDDIHRAWGWALIIDRWSIKVKEAIAFGSSASDYRRRMIQTAALAVAAVESFDRKTASGEPR